MRKLKLQVQLSIDGYVAGPNGEMDWLTWNWDDELKNYVSELTASMDTILLGRKMTDGFIAHFESIISNPADPSYEFAKIMLDTPKVVFSKTLTESAWENTILATGDIVEEVNKLKDRPGKDIIVYGGAGFVSSLVKHNLIDEYHLFLNPVIVGNGLTIFKSVEQKIGLEVIKSTAFSCGIVVNTYRPSGK